MTPINENDVVLAFRQSVEEELHRLQTEENSEHQTLVPGAGVEENLARLAQSHAHLQSEVALLRTIILKLISDPLDGSNPGSSPGGHS